MAAETTGVVVPAGVVEVVNVQDHVTDVSVAPVTIAVRVTAWFTTSVPPEGLTDTTITLPLDELPPQPLSNTQAAAIVRLRNFRIFAALILTVSPTTLSAREIRAGWPKATHGDNSIRENLYYALKRPADRKPESPQRLEIIQSPGIGEKLIQSRSELESIKILKRRIIRNQINIALLDVIRRRRNLLV